MDKERKQEIEQELETLNEELEEKNKRLEDLENNDNVEEYDDMLDGCSSEITIGNISISPSNALFKCDEIAYNMGHSDYNDSLISEITEEIEGINEDIKTLQEEKEGLK